MPKDFIPSRDADLLAWAKGNSAKLTAAPATYFVTAPIASAYADRVTAFEEAYEAAKGENAGRIDRIAKDQARKMVVASAREWGRLVQGQPAMTIEKRAELGLNLRDNPGTPINPPTAAPVVRVKRAVGRLFLIELSADASAKRSKPKGAAGAAVFAFVGATPSANPEDYVYQGQVTRNQFDLEMPHHVPAGARVWITAAWYSPRGQTSPLSEPISAYVAGGMASSADTAATFTSDDVPTLKAA